MRTNLACTLVPVEQIERAMLIYLNGKSEKPTAKKRSAFVPGMRVEARPYANADWEGNGLPPRVEGEIDYVHPKGRYISVRFRIGRAWIRECFLPADVRVILEGSAN